MYFAQWVGAVVVPLTWGTTRGWAAVILILGGIPILIAMLCLSAWLATTNRPNHRVRQVPKWYSVLTPVSWVLIAVFPLTVGASSDITTEPSALESWGFPSELVAAVVYGDLPLFFAVWIAGIPERVIPRKPEAPR